MVIIGDFSENYSFVVKDEIQSFHWNNLLCTVHPFVTHQKIDGKLVSKNYVFISPSTKHETPMVYTFLKKLLAEIKSTSPTVKKIYYFSDGCSAQYKNNYNFYNLVHHQKDFGLEAEWHFFTTSHGKNECDSLGGTVKRTAARASLQRSVEIFRGAPILNALDLFNFCLEKLSQKIQFFYVKIEDIEESEGFLAERFADAVTIAGTRSFHKFKPLPNGLMACYFFFQ